MRPYGANSPLKLRDNVRDSHGRPKKRKRQCVRAWKKAARRAVVEEVAVGLEEAETVEVDSEVFLPDYDDFYEDYADYLDSRDFDYRLSDDDYELLRERDRQYALDRYDDWSHAYRCNCFDCNWKRAEKEVRNREVREAGETEMPDYDWFGDPAFGGEDQAVVDLNKVPFYIGRWKARKR